MSEEQEVAGETRNPDGTFKPGVSGNPEGRQPMTPEQKLIKRATKELIAEYKEGLAQALPLISPVLIAKAASGDVPAIKELHDRIMGKAEQKTEMEIGLKPTPILGNVQLNNGNKENSGAQ